MNELYQTETISGDDYELIMVKGEIDISNAEAFARTALKVFETREDTVILDISDLEYVDSAGIHVLFDLARRLRLQERSFRLVLSTKAKIYKVLETTGFHKAAPIFESREAAISSSNSNVIA